MMTDRERDLVASTQDRMLRDADLDFYSKPRRNCGGCDCFSFMDAYDENGNEIAEEMGVCDTFVTIVCQLTPACDEWRRDVPRDIPPFSRGEGV